MRHVWYSLKSDEPSQNTPISHNFGYALEVVSQNQLSAHNI